MLRILPVLIAAALTCAAPAHARILDMPDAATALPLQAHPADAPSGFATMRQGSNRQVGGFAFERDMNRTVPMLQIVGTTDARM